MKKTIAFVLLACMLSGCAQLEMPRITAAAQQENDQCVLPFSQEVNGEEWTLVAWDSGEDWEALDILLQKGGENPVGSTCPRRMTLPSMRSLMGKSCRGRRLKESSNCNRRNGS